MGRRGGQITEMHLGRAQQVKRFEIALFASPDPLRELGSALPLPGAKQHDRVFKIVLCLNHLRHRTCDNDPGWYARSGATAPADLGGETAERRMLVAYRV